MEVLFSKIQYYLVEHPMISEYQWQQGHTIGSTPFFLTLTVFIYLTLTLIFTNFILLPTINSTLLRLISAVHNLTLSLLSLIMAVGATLSSLHQMPPNDFSWIICFPPNTPSKGPTFFWAHIFYFSKILEFIDTLLIIVSNSRSRRLSFLHVYHHTLTVVVCYLWLSTAQTLLVVGLVTNASVHVLMYSYYILSGLGFRPWWKRLVTDSQIVQFVLSFLVSGVMLYYHFNGAGCSGIFVWCFNALFNASLLALFVDFHAKTYARKRKDEEKNKKL